MIPILYNSSETDFSGGGVGFLSDCTRCVVTEERNGVYECEFSYPMDGRHYSEIEPDMIIKAKPNEMSDPQLFRIYRTSKPINGIVSFYCQHISYDLNVNVVDPFTLSGATALTALQGILSHCYYQHSFTAQSTLSFSETHDLKIDKPKPARMCLGGSEGSVLDLFGGEYEFDNFNIKLHAARGQDTGVTILYGKNLTDITSDVNISSAYTAVYPYAIDEERDGLYTLTEKVIETGNTNFSEPRVLSLDLTEKFNLPDEEITETKLRNLANAYITNNHISDVKQNIEISFVQLWQTPEYKDIALLQRVGLCDTVTVRYAKLGVSVKEKVIKTVYNTLTEKYEKIELGKAKSNFGMTLKESVEQIEKEVARNKSAMQKAIENATALITGQNGGYIIFRSFTDIFDDQGNKIETKTLPDGQPAEMLIMDSPNIQQATKVWRYNLSGWGYSSNGVNGPFALAATADGAIVGDRITVGKINAGLIKTGIIEDEAHKNYWNMNTGEFKLSDGTTDAVKFENGTLTINAGFITTGSLNAARITVGILQDRNGTNYWNLDTGEFRLSANTKVGTSASNQTLSNYVNSAASGSLTQQNVFNALTNNGALQGIYMSGGNLYINGTYISSGAINASLITTGSLNANLITTGTISSTSSHTKFDLSNGRITLNLSNDSWLTNSGRLELGAFGITLFDSATGTNDIGALTNIKVVDAQSGTTTIKSKIITDYGEISNLEATKISSVSELNGHPLQRILQTIGGVSYYVWGYQVT